MSQNLHVFVQLPDTVGVDPVGLLHFGQIILKRAQLDLSILLFQGLVLHATPGDVHVRHVTAEFPTIAATQLLPVQLGGIPRGRRMPEQVVMHPALEHPGTEPAEPLARGRVVAFEHGLGRLDALGDALAQVLRDRYERVFPKQPDRTFQCLGILLFERDLDTGLSALWEKDVFKADVGQLSTDHRTNQHVKTPVHPCASLASTSVPCPLPACPRLHPPVLRHARTLAAETRELSHTREQR